MRSCSYVPPVIVCTDVHMHTIQCSICVYTFNACIYVSRSVYACLYACICASHCSSYWKGSLQVNLDECRQLYIYLYLHEYVRTSNAFMCVCLQYIHVSVCTCMYVVHASMCLCVYASVHVCICACWCAYNPCIHVSKCL